VVAVTSLWLPILVSAVIVFVASSLIHMFIGWHKNDFPQLPGEDRVIDSLRPLAIPRGDYLVPRPSGRQDLRSPAFLEKLNKGPVLVMTVLPNGPVPVGRNLVQWFIYSVIVSVFSAYVAGRALGPGADYLRVFQIAGTVAFVGYALALWQMSIWYGRSWRLTVKATIDGLIYALLTAGTLGWLWPG
jgi:hypothetical protein